MTYRNCPECKTQLLPPYLSCGACPWTSSGRPQAAGDGATVQCWNRDHTVAVLAHQCCNEVRGQRCAKPGTISPTTKGTGPWFCADHYLAYKAASDSAVPPPQGFQALKDLLKRRQLDPEEAAERNALRDGL